jgi:hypothetical protein
MEAEIFKEVGMSTVVFDISMSLDGFITASGRRPEEPMGEGSQRLSVASSPSRASLCGLRIA